MSEQEIERERGLVLYLDCNAICIPGSKQCPAILSTSFQGNVYVLLHGNLKLAQSNEVGT